jgi:signal transduction histidine kinase
MSANRGQNLHQETPETYFAPADRAGREALQKAIEAASHNPVIDTVLRNFGGLIAVLNEQRQIVAVNQVMLEALGIEDAAEALGLRPGEAAGCVYSEDQPGGCGTGRYCSNCGAAIAIVSALKSGHPEERECALSARRGSRTIDLDFVVRCVPVKTADQQFLLLFLRDISDEQRRSALEQTFFHDVANLLTSLMVAGDLLILKNPEDEIAKGLRQGIDLLVKEVEIQRVLAHGDAGRNLALRERTSVLKVLDRLRRTFATHPAAEGRTLRIEDPPADVPLITDIGLLQRALMNMVVNALEGTSPGDEARIWIEQDARTVTFLVSNAESIPPATARRVFQRYFTTKNGPGRGLGTYTMKWLAETYLGGTVDFSSSEDAGTTFRLRLPAGG